MGLSNIGLFKVGILKRMTLITDVNQTINRPSLSYSVYIRLLFKINMYHTVLYLTIVFSVFFHCFILPYIIVLKSKANIHVATIENLLLLVNTAGCVYLVFLIQNKVVWICLFLTSIMFHIFNAEVVVFFSVFLQNHSHHSLIFSYVKVHVHKHSSYQTQQLTTCAWNSGAVSKFIARMMLPQSKQKIKNTLFDLIANREA